MTRDELLSFLTEEPRIGRLATVDAAGRPQYLGEPHRGLGRHLADLPGRHTTLVLEPETWSWFDYS